MTPETFWNAVEKSEACWLWKGARDRGGYGKVNWQDGTRLAHRIAYTLVRGEIPAGLQLDHLCRTPACVRPSHLEAVTNRENTIRGLAPIVNSNDDTCRNGRHPWPESAVPSATDGRPRCVECNRERARRQKMRRAMGRAA